MSYFQKEFCKKLYIFILCSVFSMICNNSHAKTDPRLKRVTIGPSSGDEGQEAGTRGRKSED